jgi:tryptophanyl-tRNA synthetase
MLSKSTRVPGTDGRKMSKSYENAIFLSDDQGTINKKVRMMITDPKRIHLKDPGHPEVCNIFDFYKIYRDKEIKEIEQRCRKGEIGCTKCKDELSEIIFKSLEQFREKRNSIKKDLNYVYDILEEGKKYVVNIADKLISDVRKKMGID